MSLRDGIVLPYKDNICLKDASHLAPSGLFEISESLSLREIAEAAVTGGFLIHDGNAVAAEAVDDAIRQFDFDDDRLVGHRVQHRAALPCWRPMS